MLGKITKSVIEKLQNLPADGKWLWDISVQGFGVRRQKDGGVLRRSLSAQWQAADQIPRQAWASNPGHRKGAGISGAGESRRWC
jgi:hypothetical protein